MDTAHFRPNKESSGPIPSWTGPPNRIARGPYPSRTAPFVRRSAVPMGTVVSAPDQPKVPQRPKTSRRRWRKPAHRALKVAEVVARLAALARVTVEFFGWLF